ncbi:MAG: hypothetical protein HYY06_21085 [Deltaproteobacteria bacterium]|nr:hypothetical protein [Deltaproteobacteria bacterium]
MGLREATAAMGLLVAACDAGNYEVRIHVPGGPDRAVEVEVSLVRSCGEVVVIGEAPASSLRTVVVVADRSGPLGPIEEGPYGLYGRAWDGTCRLYAAGCSQIRVEGGGSGDLDVYLAELSPPRGCDEGETCRSGRCVGPDAGLEVDAGSEAGIDAGADAGSEPDASVDAGADADAGSECDIDTDGDGHFSVECGGLDCDEGDSSVHPGAADNADRGTWLVETVDSGSSTGRYTSLAVDSAGAAHISYATGAGGLGHATNESGEWALRTVAKVGDYSSVAVGANGVVHFAYHQWLEGAGEIRHVTNIWKGETVDDVDGGGQVSMALDAVGGDVHIAYYASVEGAGDLRYATNRNGDWETRTVDDTEGAGGNPSLALDANGAVHIAYSRYVCPEECYPDPAELRHATTNVDGEWVVELVDTFEAEARNMSSSLAIDQEDGSAHIAYYYYTGERDLHYATNRSGEWVLETVAEEDNAGNYPSLAVDADGAVHIGYYDQGGGADLRYVTNRSGDWEHDTVDTEGQAMWMSLAVHRGDVHLSYHDFSFPGYLRHAVSGPRVDGIDQNCDGMDGVDADGDGHASWMSGGDDCDDDDETVFPEAPELGGDGIDQDCDGLVFDE